MFMNDKHSDLNKRLQSRLLHTLKRMAFFQSMRMTVPESVSKDYLKKGLMLMSLKGRLAYRWYTLIRLRLRRLMVGQN